MTDNWELRKIDEISLANLYLDNNDKCYYFLEYSVGGGYKNSKANSFILNFKKTSGQRGYKYKGLAIKEAAEKIYNLFFQRLNGQTLENLVLVPVPPSKSKEDPGYDDRIWKMLCHIKSLAKEENIAIHTMELVEQMHSIKSFHHSQNRLSIDELKKIYKVAGDLDENLKMLADKTIIVFDDVITTGTHFKAMQSFIKQTYNHDIIGLFLAKAKWTP